MGGYHTNISSDPFFWAVVVSNIGAFIIGTVAYMFEEGFQGKMRKLDTMWYIMVFIWAAVLVAYAFATYLAYRRTPRS